MFSFLKKNNKLVAPIDGIVIDISEVPDKVFAERMAGDGVAIESSGNIVVAPADGKLTMIFKTNHAFGITTSEGIEILVHIGIDTVALEGNGFERLAEEGQEIKAGKPIIKLNRDEIVKKGYSLVTPVIITNPDNIKDLEVRLGANVKAGEDEVITYKIK
jgi:sugar PTS system EIIA component